MTQPAPYDLVVIGGGVNGCGIARDAAGRGLSVCLAEAGDLAQATSSASTKLFHGGLRYLEYFELRLVREALIERERLLAAMPHIAWPMRFTLPLDPAMRFDTSTPAGRLLFWTRGRRPAWMIRAGLFLYDHLGGREILPATRALDLRQAPEGAALSPRLTRAYQYSDVWVDDARLTLLNARDAARRGAAIRTRTRVTAARREAALWRVTLRDEATGSSRQVAARALVNAAGPWAQELLQTADLPLPARLRLVRGSHIVTRRLFDHDSSYFLQGPDGRIIFMIPYEGDFTLIGTTDQDHAAPDTKPRCTEAERDYLIAFANRYLAQPIGAADVVWSYSGVRPLYDDGAGTAQSATRDYVLKLDQGAAALGPAAGGQSAPPILSVFGGKITTYRKLAEAALARLTPLIGGTGPWTAGVPLPGGDFPVAETARRCADLHRAYPFLSAALARRIFRAYGLEAAEWLGTAQKAEDLGRDFGAGLSEAELTWMRNHEYARSAEDALWRRSKLGLRMSAAEARAVEDWFSG